MLTVLHDASRSGAEDNQPWGPFRGSVETPLFAREDLRGQGRKFHHLRPVPMTTSNERARELIAQYGGLVRSICLEPRYAVRKQVLMDRDDMFAIGCTIMIQSAEMYDPSRGAKLSTWIGFRVRQGLMAVVKELHGTMQEDGGTARALEIAYAENDLSKRVHVMSLDQQVRGQKASGNHEGITLLDTIEDESPPADERLEECQERVWLMKALRSCCTATEHDIVLRTLAGETGQSIGSRYGLTRQRVDQIHQGAIEKLRRRRWLEDAKRTRALRSQA